MYTRIPTKYVPPLEIRIYRNRIATIKKHRCVHDNGTKPFDETIFKVQLSSKLDEKEHKKPFT